MAHSDAKQSLDALVKSIVETIDATSATHQAVHKQIQSVLEATTATAIEMIRNNAYSPALALENLKLQKTMIERTINIIKAPTPQG